ncbi:hypothetical protein CL656_00165 [bacterium]|nr:hypothetical protein [bacterium]
MALVKEYFDLTKQYKLKYGSKTILFMQVGAFFEVYGLKRNKLIDDDKSDITKFSRMCELIIADKKICVGEHGVVMAGFRDYMIDKYLKKMQENGYTIVVYKQDQQSKNTTRSLAGIFSPGTLFFDEEQDDKLSNNICCIWIRKNKNSILMSNNLNIGICNIDVFTGKTNVFEFETENYKNPCSFDELEQFISIYNPTECILIYNVEEDTIESIIQFIGLNSKKNHKINIGYDNESELKKKQKEDQNYNKCIKCENQIYQNEILQKYYKNELIEIIKETLHYNILSLQCLCYLLEFIHEHNPSLVDVLDLPVFNNQNQRCILANHSLKQLNILSQYTNDQYDKYTLERIINLCKTNMGKRKFRQILLNPICNIDQLNNSYDIIEHVYNKEYITKWDKELINIRDIERLKRKCILKKISPYDFYCLNDNLLQIKKIIKTVTKDKKLEKILNISKNSKNCTSLIKFIDKYFIINECKNHQSNYFDKSLQQNDFKNFIKKNNFEEYDNCLRNKSDYECCLQEYVDYLSRLIFEEEQLTKKNKSKGSYKGYVKIHITPSQGISLLITKKRANLLKKVIERLYNKNIIVSYFSKYDNITKEMEFDTEIEINTHISKNMSITSHTLKELFFNMSNIDSEFSIRLHEVYNDIVMEFDKLEENFYEINEFVMQLDILYAKVKLINMFHLNKPKIKAISKKNKNSYVNIKGLRHLIIEQMNNDEIYIANDIQLNMKNEKSPRGILLFGTNAVGKTSFIKSLGIAVIMAQAGLYVPCEKMEYYPYEYIFTRILGNDNIFKGLSTFAVEMSELRVILNKSNNNSLILGDELCSGTENESAISIFMSSLEELYKNNSSFIFATHFHEIVHYDELKEMKQLQCKHMKVKYNNELNKLIYDRKLCEGSGEPIYGLEVCKSLKMPDLFLDRAYELRNKYSGHRDKNILNMKITKYNNDKIKGLCEFCKENLGTEIHHLQYQNKADKKDNYIVNENQIFHKDHKANLSSICEKCHNQLHKMNLVYKKQKTNDGYILTISEK